MIYFRKLDLSLLLFLIVVYDFIKALFLYGPVCKIAEYMSSKIISLTESQTKDWKKNLTYFKLKNIHT
jgi:hypothetical protein